MDAYPHLLGQWLRRSYEIWSRRLEDELEEFAAALNFWLESLFARPTVNWQERFDTFLAEQEAQGRVVTPQSRQDLTEFLADWAKTVEWAPRQSDVAKPPRMADRTPAIVLGRQRISNRHVPGPQREAPYLRHIEIAWRMIDELNKALAAVAQDLESGREDFKVDTDLFESLIWHYHDALESAAEEWLKKDLSLPLLERHSKLPSRPIDGLPRYIDEQQARRAAAIGKRIAERTGRTLTTLDNVVFTMQVTERVGDVAGYGTGGLVLLKAAKEGGKWAIKRTLVKAAGGVAGAAAGSYMAGQATEHGMRAAGASEQTIHSVQNAAEMVTWLIMLRRVQKGIPRAGTSGKPKAKGLPGTPEKKAPGLQPGGASLPSATPPTTPSGSTALVPTAPVELGKWGEIRLKQLLGGLGFKPTSAFKTSLGKRYIDRMLNGVAYEAKAGLNVDLTPAIKAQALKDAELITKKKITGAHWYFLRGATPELLAYLKSLGIVYTVY